MLKTIKGQIIASYVLTIFVLYILLSQFTRNVFNDLLLTTHLEHQTQTTEALSKSIGSKRSGVEELSFYIVNDSVVQRVLGLGVENASRADVAQFTRVLWQYKLQIPSVAKVYIIDDAYQIHGTDLENKNSSYLFNHLSRIDLKDDAVQWDSGYGIGYSVLYRRISDGEGKLGYLFMIIDNHLITDLFDDYRLDSTQRFSLRNDTGFFEIVERGFFYNVQDEYYNRLHFSIEYGDWLLNTWTNQEVVLAPTGELFRVLNRIFVGLFLFSILLITFFSFRITAPISKFKRVIKKYGEGDLTIRAKSTTNNEIGELANAFNLMAEEIGKLFEEVRQKEEQRQKLELQTLVYQINPHFLYNTLDSIYYLARKNNDKVADIVIALSRLFRLGFNRGNDTVSVRDEVMHVSYYMKIQQIRFSAQLSWNVEVDEEILNMEIMKFILQPCAENAINHGIRKLERPGTVTITGKRENSELVFQVIDDGAGIEKERLVYIIENLNAPQRKEKDDIGFGLYNVHQRIKLYYGSEYGIQIVSKPNTGTVITIKLPL